MNRSSLLSIVVVTASLLAASCGNGSADSSAEQNQTSPDVAASDAPNIREVSPGEATAIQSDPPDDLVVLDVRTPEEFAEGHLDGAIQIDFYDDDFAEQLLDLDTDVPYLIYCRSGNRSGQTRAMMRGIGFTDVADLDGGVLAWTEAGYPLVSG
jgi:rhodanese-related sulfurtransferase